MYLREHFKKWGSPASHAPCQSCSLPWHRSFCPQNLQCTTEERLYLKADANHYAIRPLQGWKTEGAQQVLILESKGNRSGFWMEGFISLQTRLSNVNTNIHWSVVILQMGVVVPQQMVFPPPLSFSKGQCSQGQLPAVESQCPSFCPNRGHLPWCPFQHLERYRCGGTNTVGYRLPCNPQKAKLNWAKGLQQKQYWICRHQLRGIPPVIIVIWKHRANGGSIQGVCLFSKAVKSSKKIGLFCKGAPTRKLAIILKCCHRYS